MTLGGAVIAGVFVMALVLSQVGGTTTTVEREGLPQGPLGIAVGPATTTSTIGSDDVAMAAALGGVVAVFFVALGVVAWVTLRHDPWFDETLDELYASGWVRAIGLPLTVGALVGVTFLVIELAIATPERPADLRELGPMAGGSAVLALLVYLPLAAIAWLVRRVRGIPPDSPSNPAPPPA